MKTPAEKLRTLMARYKETAIANGVTVQIVDGIFVIDSENGRGAGLAASTSYPELIEAFMFAVHGNDEEYKGHTITAKLDFGDNPYLVNGASVRHGWVVVKDGCNAMPGAIWFGLRREARKAIDILIETDGDSDAFWMNMVRIKNIQNPGASVQ